MALEYATAAFRLASSACQTITSANSYVMNRHRQALEASLKAPVLIQGFTDLTLGNLKFSGNAQRRCKRFTLFHGSFLLNMDIGLMASVLPFPKKHPAYRKGRSHAEFLTNLNQSTSLLQGLLIKTWDAKEPLKKPPLERTSLLAHQKYSNPDWNFKY